MSDPPKDSYYELKIGESLALELGEPVSKLGDRDTIKMTLKVNDIELVYEDMCSIDESLCPIRLYVDDKILHLEATEFYFESNPWTVK